MTSKTKQIIIAVVIIVIAFVGFKVFFGSTDSGSATLATDAPATTPELIDGQAILILLNRLGQVKLDTSIFSDPIFASLTSFARPIPNQIPGRKNPFAPIGADGPGVISTSTPATLSPSVF